MNLILSNIFHANYNIKNLEFFQGVSLLVDYFYYGRWTSSVLNLLHYNVVGGGESHLYGTEGPLYYLRNGFNNFNFCFVLALLFLGILPIARIKYVPDLLIVVSPMYIWLGFMSLQPHKEERFGIFTFVLNIYANFLCLFFFFFFFFFFFLF
jgi:hypothetical protein